MPTLAAALNVTLSAAAWLNGSRGRRDAALALEAARLARAAARANAGRLSRQWTLLTGQRGEPVAGSGISAVVDSTAGLIEGHVYHAGHGRQPSPASPAPAGPPGYTIHLSLPHPLTRLAMDLTAIIDAEVQALLAKLPKVSAADEADLAAIEPHVRAILMRDAAGKLLTELASKFPSLSTTFQAATSALTSLPA